MEDKIDMHFNLEAPVLLIGFNRPDTIQKVFEKIREVQPAKLYVAVDGPRHNKLGEVELGDKVKQIVQQVDWKCESYYKYNTKNLGAEVTVSNAVTWALEENDFVIVLEDDIIAPLSFFKFAQEMLFRYKNNNQIVMVSGMNTTPIQLKDSADYTFGIYGHTNGWATWKRAWEKFNLYVNDFDVYLNLNGNTINQLVNTKEEKKYWKKIINRMKKRGMGNSSWDYCWSYIRFKEQGLNIIPKVNLTSNIGVVGLHARGQTEYHYLPYDEYFEVKNHPLEVRRNVEYDKYHFENHINRKNPLIRKIINKALSTYKLR
jgi:hypothetical protein